MGSLSWILIAIAGLLLILGVAFVMLKKKSKRPVDYYSLFIMGIIWLPAGFAIKNYALSVIGLVFLIIGLVNRDKWKQNKKKWEDLDEGEKKWMKFIIFLLSVLVLAGFIFFLVFSKIS
jgi:formate hydrogenlyase subunit 3/multisubunit Na+/H+ antiporter MnhD subunit